MNLPWAPVAWRWVLGIATVVLATFATKGASAQVGEGTSVKGASLRVVVSIAPLQGLVEPLVRAAGMTGTVDVLIPPGRSEHGYEIPPSKLAGIEAADIVVLVGLGLEPQVEKYLSALESRGSGARRVVVFADTVGEKAEEGHEHHHHEHGEECDHGHGADPHLWLDPVLVERFVGKLTETVADAAGDAAAAVRVREAGVELRKRVLAMHEQYALTCGGFASKTVVVGHDAWGRLADRYGLETVAIAGLMAGEPTPKALEKAKATVREKKLKVVFVEPQLSDRAGRRIAEATGAEVRKLDPLGNGDWFAMMEGNLAELRRALGGGEAVPKKDPGEAAKE